MVIYCDNNGNVQSVPSMVAFGETLTDITIVTPQQSVAVLLKIEPPTGEHLPDMICAPIINQDGIRIYNAKVLKSVTAVSGRCYYQLEFVGGGEYTEYDENGEPSIGEGVIKWHSEKGSFNIRRGTNIDLPLSNQMLKDYALEELYALLASISQTQDRTKAVEDKLGIEKQLETAGQNIVDAINELNRKQGVTLDVTLTQQGVAADAKAVGDALANKISSTDVVDSLTSTDTKKPLSANQGTVLNGLIDGLSQRVHAIEQIPYAEEVGF